MEMDGKKDKSKRERERESRNLRDSRFISQKFHETRKKQKAKKKREGINIYPSYWTFLYLLQYSSLNVAHRAFQTENSKQL